MRILSAVLCFCLSFNLMAATTVQEFEKALDNYQYTMTSEWDQVDTAFSAQATHDFYLTLSDLMAKGLTEEDMMNVLTQKSVNKKDLEALKVKMASMASQAHTAEDLAQVIATQSKNLYRRGASWDGSVIIMYGVGVVIVAALAYSIWFSSTHTCVAYAQGTQCGWTSYYYGGPQYYQCWPTTYCTQYVKN